MVKRRGSHKFVTYAINGDITSMERMIKKGYIPFDDNFDCIKYYNNSRVSEEHNVNVLKNLEKFYQGDYSKNYNSDDFNKIQEYSVDVLKYLYETFAKNDHIIKFIMSHISNFNGTDGKNIDILIKYYFGKLNEDIKKSKLFYTNVLPSLITICFLIIDEKDKVIDILYYFDPNIDILSDLISYMVQHNILMYDLLETKYKKLLTKASMDTLISLNEYFLDIRSYQYHCTIISEIIYKKREESLNLILRDS